MADNQVAVKMRFKGGKSTVEVVGGCGPSCKDLTASIQQALGTTVSDDPTPDIHKEMPKENPNHASQF